MSIGRIPGTVDHNNENTEYRTKSGYLGRPSPHLVARKHKVFLVTCLELSLVDLAHRTLILSGNHKINTTSKAVVGTEVFAPLLHVSGSSTFLGCSESKDATRVQSVVLGIK